MFVKLLSFALFVSLANHAFQLDLVLTTAEVICNQVNIVKNAYQNIHHVEIEIWKYNLKQCHF